MYEQIGMWLMENVVVLYLVILWSLIWKGIALWKSARNKQVVWFIVLFVINTAGILPIVYLAFFQRKRKIKQVKKKKK